MKIGLVGAFNKVGQELVVLGAIPIGDVTERTIRKVNPDIIIYSADFEVRSTLEYDSACGNVRWLYEVANLYIPTILVSSEAVFGKKKWFGHKEKGKRNPTSLYGVVKIGIEAVAALFPNVKIVRGNDAEGIMRFAERFEEMPTVLHVQKKPTILNTRLAYKLGILWK
jgi:dTDP-4-dehydrorhamnose reductase